MRVKAKTTFQSTYHGQVEAGTEFEVDGALGRVWIDAGIVEAVNVTKVYYNTKVVGQAPQVGDVPLASGPVSESSLSPAAQVSQSKTPKSSGKKKRL